MSRRPSPQVNAPAATGKGAVQSKTSVKDVARSYFGHHRTSLAGAFWRLLATPMQTLMTSLVVAIALALPATLLVALSNVQQLGDSWDANPKMSVYINTRARDLAVEQLVERIERMPDVDSVVFLSAEQALREFQAMSGFGEALSGLDDNPLPATLIVTPTAQGAAPEHFKRLGDKIAEDPIVDEVSLDLDWVKRLRELMVLGKKIVLALAALLGLGVLLAIGNTIRLSIESRRDEIIVTKLVGGTDGFVRRPFLYSGAWYGFFGGVLACIILSIGFLSVEGSVARLALLYHGDFELLGLGVVGNIQLLGLSTFLGLFGAWIAVGRHLADIEPS